MAGEIILQAADRLILQDGGTVDRPEWEPDVVTARFECKTSLVKSLIPTWGTPHPTWDSLAKVSHRLRENKGGMSSMDCTYRGLVDGIAPPVRIRSTLSLVDVSLSLHVNLTGLEGLYEPSIEISVYLPDTSFDYYVTKKPKGPKYKGRIDYVEGSFEIGGRRGSKREGTINLIVDETLRSQMAKGSEIAGGSTSPSKVANAYNGYALIVTSGYSSEEVAKNLWRVSEKNSIRILPNGGDDRFIRMMGT